MKKIVITGSTRGIGFGLANAFLDLGCKVVVSGRSNTVVGNAVVTLSACHNSDDITGIACDVTQYEQVQALWDTAKNRLGTIDIWINNAGIAHETMDYWEIKPELMKSVVETNLLGAMYGSRVALKEMLTQGFGAIYNLEGLGSNGGRKVKGLSIYGTTKAGLRYLDESLALETKGTSVIVGAIAPGMVITDLITAQYAGKPDDFKKVRPIFNIIADRVETVTPWLAKQVLDNKKNGARISWANSWRILARFLTAPFFKRNVFS